MRLTRILLALTLFAALPLAAAPQIAVYRNWDNVQVNKFDLVDYGDTDAGVPISRLFRIENHGNATLNVSVSLGSQSLGFFVITDPAPTVPPGGNTTFRIRLFAHTDGRYFGYVNVNSNDPATPLFQFTTNGYVHGPLISVYQSWTGLAQPNASSYDFGTVAAGTVVQRSFTIVNSGTRSLTISNASRIVSGAAFVQAGVPATTVVQGGSTTVTVRFAPTAPNTIWDGQIFIENNDYPRSPYVIYLTGRTN